MRRRFAILNYFDRSLRIAETLRSVQVLYGSSRAPKGIGQRTERRDLSQRKPRGNRWYSTGLGIQRRDHFVRHRLSGATQSPSDREHYAAFIEEALAEATLEVTECRALRAYPIPAFGQQFAEESKPQDTTTTSLRVCRLLMCASQVKAKSLDSSG